MTADGCRGIRAGENAWQPLLPIRGPKGLDLAPLAIPLQPFFRSFETVCAAGWCGIDAFAFPPEDIREAALMDPLGRDAVLEQLLAVQNALAASDSDTAIGSPFDTHVARTSFLLLIEHLVAHVRAAKSSSEGDRR